MHPQNPFELAESLKNMLIEHNIETYLSSGFEKQLFEAALYNLKDDYNKLRLNSFAFSLRELTRHFLARLSPDEEVKQAPWFIVHDPTKPGMVTRIQRMRYAIHGWLRPEYVETELGIDTEEIIKDLNDGINKLSKFTHVNPPTFNCDNDTVMQLKDEILESMLSFFQLITESKERVERAAFECVDNEMVSSFYGSTFNEIDELATHHEIEYFNVNRMDKVGEDDSNFYMEADGCVHVRLQYGSDGDLRRGDGHEMALDFPFTSTFTVSFRNKKGDVHLTDPRIEIDTTSFYA